LTEQQALAVLDREGIPPMTDPVAALQELAAEAMELKRYFADRLAALEQLRYEGRAGEQLRAEVALFERALDRVQRFALDLAKLGLEDRMVAVTEAQGRMLAQAVEAALQACGLEDRQDLRHEVAVQLRLAATADESLQPRAWR
jgi:hypothetical protein